jgi:type I restriction enzyme S subunit
MNAVSKSSAYPASVQPGIPSLPHTPNGWVRSSLSEYLHSAARPVKMKDDQTYRLVTVKRSRGGVVLRENLKGCEISVKSQFEIKKGDFLISRRQIVHGACGLVPSDLDGSIVSNEYAVLRGSDQICLAFLNYLAHSIYFQQTCFHSSIGVHVEKMIFKLDRWLKWDFNIPPLAEQKRIAEILSTWDRAIETTEKLIANSEAQKKALMQRLLTGKKRVPGFSGAWEHHAFGRFAHTVRNKVDPRSLRDDVPGIELEHIEAESGRLLGTCQANAQVSLKTPFTRKNVLYGKLRPYLRKFFKPDFDGVCSTEIWALAAKPDLCTPEFLHLLVQSPTFAGAVDVSSGSKMPRADWGIVAVTIFAIPSVKEQTAIAGILRDADRAIEVHESQLTALRQEKSALMQQLLTGKRRVKLPEKIHA